MSTLRVMPRHRQYHYQKANRPFVGNVSTRLAYLDLGSKYSLSLGTRLRILALTSAVYSKRNLLMYETGKGAALSCPTGVDSCKGKKTR